MKLNQPFSSITLTGVTLISICSSAYAQNTIFVNPSAKESKTTVHTFQQARDAIRYIRQNDPAKRKTTFTVLVAPGTYQFTHTLELGPKEYNRRTSR